jgi:endonuclease YncB( thermonuclease family)
MVTELRRRIAALIGVFVALAMAGCNGAASLKAAVQDDRPCHLYSEHRKQVDAPAEVPVLKDRKVPLYKVEEVTDGDTIVIAKDGRTRIRLLGIDTPERTTTRNGRIEYYGEEAFQYSRSLIEASNWEVRITYDQVKKDRYGRDLAYV